MHDFERTIECLILDAQRGSSSTTEDALDLGKRLDQNPKFDTSGKTLVAAGEIHSRQRTGKTYLTGAPTLSSLFID